MKQEKTWRLRAEYVRWAAVLFPKVWTQIPLQHCWIDGHSAYAVTARFSRVIGTMVELKLNDGTSLEVSLAMLGPEERHRVNRLSGSGDKTPPPHEAACA